MAWFLFVGRLSSAQRADFSAGVTLDLHEIWLGVAEASLVNVPHDRFYAPGSLKPGRNLTIFAYSIACSKRYRVDLIFCCPS